MKYYKAKIQYDGGGFAGFQWQKNVDTIQSEINNTLEKLLGETITTQATSRTDRGVHALCQMLRICTNKTINTKEFLPQINSHISSQIKFLSLEECEWTYKPGLFAKEKEYRYYFTNLKDTNTEQVKYIANTAYSLDMDLLYKCISMLKGEHDFVNFSSTGSSTKSTIRIISECKLSVINPQKEISDCDLFKIPDDIKECFELRISANGFLKQMIRHIVSAIWRVASHKMDIAEFESLLSGKNSTKQIWRVAPAKGLFLYNIRAD